VLCPSQDVPTIHVLHGTDDPVEGENIVQFRLLYSGRLPAASASNSRTKMKHQIRLEFHPQLKQLWLTNKHLRQACRTSAAYWGQKHPEFREELRPGLPIDQAENWTHEELEMVGRRALAEQWSRCGRGFIPLITQESCESCSLDVLFLRPEGSGMVLRGGDIDNRLKTLFDALRLPDNLDEAGGTEHANDESPTYCLLQDDNLISEVRIVTDQLLLLPKERELHTSDVFLVIDVKVSAPSNTKWKFAFG